MNNHGNENRSLDLMRHIPGSDDDFEWYPTTDEIISALVQDMQAVAPRFSGDSYNVLDIGAGDGRVLTAIKEANLRDDSRSMLNLSLYAIEKSMPLISAMPEEISIIGCDFAQQTLIDKEMDFVFCNPPYSDYAHWADRIIRETNGLHVYLVIPVRWENNPSIQQAIKLRKAETEIIGEFDFYNAERQARARVHLVRIDLAAKERWHKGEQFVDPFSLWFDQQFADALEDGKADADADEASFQEKVGQRLVEGGSLIHTLVALYDEELQQLVSTYDAVCRIDRRLIEEIVASVGVVKNALKSKIGSIKSRYWRELFHRLERLSYRLTSKTRDRMLQRLQENASLDFNVDNAYAVTLWAIKNANQYCDQQLIEVFDQMLSHSNVFLYKSNQKTIQDSGWRYARSRDSDPVGLDYRIVLHYVGGVRPTSGYHWGFHSCNLHQDGVTFLSDLFIVARNLGFDVMGAAEEHVWEPGKPVLFELPDGEVFARVKGYMNGNMHIQFNQRFIRRLNVEAGRLLGWINSPSEAADELDIPIEEAAESFGSNYRLEVAASSVPQLIDGRSDDRDDCGEDIAA